MSIDHTQNRTTLPRIISLTLIFLGICGLIFAFLLNTVIERKYGVDLLYTTPVSPTEAPSLPQSLTDVQTNCARGECISSCLNSVDNILQKESFQIPLIYSIEDTELVYYGIRDGKELYNPRKFNVPTDLKPYQNDTDAHEFIWNYFKNLVPIENRLDLVTLGIYIGSESNGKFDTTATENWVMKINMLALSDADTLSHVLIHEFTHYLTLNRTQIDNSGSKKCKQIALYYCQSKDSYLNIFFVDFWEDIYPEWEEIKTSSLTYEKDISLFYKKYEPRFLEKYSATGPIEDIAVSFEAFILEPPPSGNAISDQKVQFFYRFPELVQLREQIIKNICTFPTKK